MNTDTLDLPHTREELLVWKLGLGVIPRGENYTVYISKHLVDQISYDTEDSPWQQIKELEQQLDTWVQYCITNFGDLVQWAHITNSLHNSIKVFICGVPVMVMNSNHPLYYYVKRNTDLIMFVCHG